MPNVPFTQTLYPMLSVKNIQETYSYYTRVLGFLPGNTMPGPDGKWMHAEVMLGSVHLMFGTQEGAKSDPTLANTAWVQNTSKGTVGGVNLYVNLGPGN